MQDAPAIPSNERVLWHARAGFGVSAAERRRLRQLTVALSCGLAPFSLALIGALLMLVDWTPTSGPMVAFGISLALYLCVVYAVLYLRAWLRAPFPLLFGAAVPGVLVGAAWALALEEGVGNAFALLAQPWLWIAAAVSVVCGCAVFFRAVERTKTHYTITDRAAYACVGVGPEARRLWRVPVARGWRTLRAIQAPGDGRGHIAIGTGPYRRLIMHVEEPRRALVSIREALGQPADTSVPDRAEG